MQSREWLRQAGAQQSNSHWINEIYCRPGRAVRSNNGFSCLSHARWNIGHHHYTLKTHSIFTHKHKPKWLKNELKFLPKLLTLSWTSFMWFHWDFVLIWGRYLLSPVTYWGICGCLLMSASATLTEKEGHATPKGQRWLAGDLQEAVIGRGWEALKGNSC